MLARYTLSSHSDSDPNKNVLAWGSPADNVQSEEEQSILCLCALAPLTCLDMVGQSVTAADLRSYLSAILLRVLELRDREAGGQCRGPLRQALTYIDSHFTDGPLSLNQVARAVNISPNYLSAVFSQEMGETFTEYVTGRRMELARELLRTTDKRSGEVAAAVGYRDPHYFSFLFKKTQGCTPRDYRSGARRG